MDKELLKKVVDRLKKEVVETALFDDGSQKNIDMDKFIEIVKPSKKEEISFIDGGNLDIISSPSLMLTFNRVYSCTYKNNVRIKNLIVEFYSLTEAKEQENKLKYFSEIFFIRGNPGMKKTYCFDAFDRSLMNGNKKAEITLIPGIIRRLAELEIIMQLPNTGKIIIDGNLEPVYPYEKDVIKRVKEYNKDVFGFTKTAGMLTKNGDSLAAVLTRTSKTSSWIFNIGDKEDEGLGIIINMVKLTSSSKHIFRLDCFSDNKDSLMDAASLLKENSKDPIFPGYPYGLIEADRFARVSFKEQDALVLRLKMLMKDKFLLLEPYLSCSDAHSILDHLG